MMDLQRGEPVAVSIPGVETVQAGTFLNDIGNGRVRVWVGSGPKVVRRDQINSAQRVKPLRRYESLWDKNE